MNDPNARPAAGQPSAGIATGDETRYADGARQGEVKYLFGAKATVTRDMPGWFVADGTQPDLIVAGVNYGKPNLTGRMIVGANDDLGGGGTFPVGATGGSTTLAAHTHAFTQPNNHTFTHEAAHGITQPSFLAPTAHTITQPVFDAPTAHGDHAIPVVEFVATGLAPGATGIYAITGAVGLGTPRNFAHTNNHAPVPLNRSTSVALSNNHDAPAINVNVALSNNSPHSGGAVDAHAGGAVGAVVGTVAAMPPYLSMWPLIKVYA